MTDDKYTYPGSGGVLVNRRGIRDPETLDEALNYFASRGWALLKCEDIPHEPGAGYLAHIHRTMFSPLLSWVGELRDVDAGAGGTGIAYARPTFIEPSLTDLFSGLRAVDYLRGLPRAQFAAQLGEAWGTLTAIHPFRDGNTRSQSAYVSALTARAGFEIDWPGLDVDELREVRMAAVSGRDQGLKDLLGRHVIEVSD